MTFAEKLLFYITVPKCVFCDEKLDIDDRVFCKSCRKEYLKHKELNCATCANVYSRCTCSNAYMRSHGIKTFFKVFRYDPQTDIPSNFLIYSLKQDNRKDVFRFCAEELADAVTASGLPASDMIVTNVPRRKKGISEYGYDHAAVLAKHLARLVGCEYRGLLISNNKNMQKHVSAEERKNNPKFALRRDEPDLSGKTVMIVDDVVTTGASMSQAAMLIRSLGAKSVCAAALSISYRDEGVYFDTEDKFSGRKQKRHSR